MDWRHPLGVATTTIINNTLLFLETIYRGKQVIQQDLLPVVAL